jgi:hypothetical protein
MQTAGTFSDRYSLPRVPMRREDNQPATLEELTKWVLGRKYSGWLACKLAEEGKC